MASPSGCSLYRSAEATSRSYEAKLEQWQRCRDCSEGGDAVKARGEASVLAAQLSGNETLQSKCIQYWVHSHGIEAIAHTEEPRRNHGSTNCCRATRCYNAYKSKLRTTAKHQQTENLGLPDVETCCGA